MERVVGRRKEGRKEGGRSMLLESTAGTKRRVRIESRHKSTRYSIDPGSEISQCQGCFFFFFF